jgi:hypothetical protein
VREDASVDGMLGVGVLRSGVEEGATAKSRPLDVRGDVGSDCANGVRRRLAAGPCRREAGSEAAISLREVGNHQILLPREVPVQRRSGRVRLRQDPIDPDRVQPFCIEDPACSGEQPRSLRRNQQALAGRQWPMMLSGGISVVAGAGFILMAGAPNASLINVAGYAALGGIFFLVSALRLGHVAAQH